MNLGLQLALGGFMKRGGWTGDLISMSEFIVARNQALPVMELARIDLQIIASQTTAPAPAAVTFDIYTNSRFFSIKHPLHECALWITYDDEGSEYLNIPADHPFGKDANLTQGGSGAHRWNSFGDKVVKAYAYHPPTGWFGYKEITITVTDPDVVFSGNKTIAVALDNDFTGAPAGSQQFDNLTSARSAFYSLGAVNKRLLFKSGENYGHIADIFDQTFDEYIYIGNWGGSAFAEFELEALGSAGSNRCMFYFNGSSGSHIYGLKISGNYDPTNGTGENYTDRGVLYKGGARHAISNCEISGVGLPIYASGSAATVEGLAVIDNYIHDWYDLGCFVSSDVLGILGNKIIQNTGAISGQGEKGNYENDFPGDDTTDPLTLTNVRLFGEGGSYLAVALADYSLDTIEYWTEGVEYTLAVGSNDSGGGISDHVLTPLTPVPTGKTLLCFTRRWADHGPIRVSQGYGVLYHKNDLGSYNGWSGSGTDIQPCIRDNTDGTEGFWSFCNQNRMIGGYTVILRSPANENITQYSSDFICEANYLQGDASTQFMARLYSPGCTYRNNFEFMPNVAEAAGSQFTGGAQYGVLGAVPLTDFNKPVYIGNNHLVCLVSTANGVNDVYASSAYYNPIHEAGDGFTNVVTGNEFIYCPDRPTPAPDYTPVDENNLYRPKEGSAALDTGTLLPFLWDDWVGKLVGETASIGMFDTASPFTQAEFTRSPATAAQSSTFTILAGSDWKLTHSFIIPSSFSTVSGVIALVGETTGALTRIVFDSGSNPNGANRLYLGGVSTVMAYDSVIVNDVNVHTLEIKYLDATGLLYLTVDGVPSGSGTPDNAQQLDGNFAITVNNYRATLADAFNATLYCNHIALYTEMEIDGAVEMAFDYSSGALNGEAETASSGAGTLLMYGNPVWS